METSINLNRIALLIKNDYFLHAKNLFYFFIGAAVVNIIVNIVFIPNYIGMGWRTYYPHPEVILILLLILTSFSFYEIDFQEKSFYYLLQPATLIEKYLSRLISTLAGYLLLGSALFMIDVFIMLALNSWMYTTLLTNGYNVFNPMNYNLSRFLSIYLLLHSVFFFGAVYFKKNEFIKTIVMIAVFILYFLSFAKALNILFAPGLNISFFLSITKDDFTTWAKMLEYKAFMNELWEIIRTILLYIVPVFFWALGYFRLKETEGTDGV